MKRDVYISSIFLLLLAALGGREYRSGKKGDRRRRGGGHRHGAQIRSRPVLAEAAAEPLDPRPDHRRVGRCAGSRLDHSSRRARSNPTKSHATTNPPIAQCCAPAPPVLEFDQDGNLIGHWGGQAQGYDWPDSNHGITVDYKGNVWIGGNGRGRRLAARAGRRAPPAAKRSLDESQTGGIQGYFNDSMVLKFTQDGKFLMQIGKPGQSKGSNDIENLRLPAKTFVDQKTNEVYVADGYGNHRVIVYDADTGKYKRHWGAYGHKPDDASLGHYNPNAPPAQQFRNPVHCAELSVDRLLYVCDRANDRIQVFKPDGTFVKEMFINKETLGIRLGVGHRVLEGCAAEVHLPGRWRERQGPHSRSRLARDADDASAKAAASPAQFYGVHSIATDSKGNIYTTETYRGQRVQKFVYKGMAPVTKEDQGVVWPKK